MSMTLFESRSANHSSGLFNLDSTIKINNINIGIIIDIITIKEKKYSYRTVKLTSFLTVYSYYSWPPWPRCTENIH